MTNNNNIMKFLKRCALAISFVMFCFVQYSLVDGQEMGEQRGRVAGSPSEHRAFQ
jgi:hypothetical protein